MPFYVAPEQVMKDRADYAPQGDRQRACPGRRGTSTASPSSPRTARRRCARSARSTTASPSPASVATTSSTSCGSPGCAADLKGFQYSRDDVDARSLANQYAQILGQIFTHEMKPLEVEILVAEVGQTPAGDQMFHIQYGGTVFDHLDHTVLGGDAEAILGRLAESYLLKATSTWGAVRAGVATLAGPGRTSLRPIRRCRAGPAADAAASGASATTKSPHCSDRPAPTAEQRRRRRAPTLLVQGVHGRSHARRQRDLTRPSAMGHARAGDTGPGGS